MQNSNVVWATFLVVLVIGIIVFTLGQPVSVVQKPENGVATSSSTSLVPAGNAMEFEVPDFRAPIAYGSTISADVRAAIQKSAEIIESRLSQNSLDLESWISLGTLRKMGGDYEGAKEAWIFVTKASPQNSIAFNNLGDLYTNFLKDYSEAESTYLSAIKISPTEENPYRELYWLYTNFYKKGTSAAEDILERGVKNAPDSIDLHVLLARHYKAAGRSTEARAEYQAAVVSAKKAGLPDAAEQIASEGGL